MYTFPCSLFGLVLQGQKFRILSSTNFLRHVRHFKISRMTMNQVEDDVKLVYPVIRRDESVIDNYHGTEVCDPYRYLEDPKSEETKDFVEKQNSLTMPFINKCLHKGQINDVLTEKWNFEKRMTYMKHGNRYYQLRNSGLQNQNVLYVQDKLDEQGSVFLDPNAFAEDGTIALSGFKFSEDGSTLAYSLSANGSDWVQVKFRDTVTGDDYDEVLEKVKFSSLTWMHDNKGFFYGAYLEQLGQTDGSETDSNKNQKLYYHRLGTPQSQDIKVVEYDDPLIRISTTLSDCGDYLILTPIKGCKHNLLYYCNLKNVGEITGPLPIVGIVTDFFADYEFIANDGSNAIFRTNKDAPNYQLIRIDFNNPSEQNWKVLVPEHPKDVLDWALAVNNDNIVLSYIRDVKDVLVIHCLKSGTKIRQVPMQMGSITGVAAKRMHTEMFFCFQSFLIPNVVYRIDFTTTDYNMSVVHQSQIKDFNPNDYETIQVFYKSNDLTEIPMYIVRKKTCSQEDRPTLLYGYGGFNVAVGPMFSVSRLVFISNFNGTFALANIRGGGEYGEKWHNAGRFSNKQNVFDDFICAAQYLVDNKYTLPQHLTIQGASNGGLLIAACINQRPELFGAAICSVGVLDMLRFHLFTIGYAWKSDYGCSDDPEQFKYLIKYSPLHNVRIPQQGQYPATLLLTADHDDRVVPLHSFKFIAELQHVVGRSAKQTNPLLIRIDTRAGHGGGKPTSKLIDEWTDIYSFLQKSLGLKFYE